MESYDKVTKDALTMLYDVVQELREIDPTMELNKLLIYLSVALRDGVEAQRLADEFGMPKTSMSNIVLALSPQGYRKDKKGNQISGLGLIIQEPSERDARAKELYLTFDGKQLVDRLTQIVKRKTGDGT